MIRRRTCAVCGKTKSLAGDFYRDRKSAEGYRKDCKECRRRGDTRRSAGPPSARPLHAGIAAEVDPLDTSGLPEELQKFANNPEFQTIMAEQSKIKPARPPTGVYAPRELKDNKRADQSVRTLVLITDVHVPDHDKGYWKALLSFLRQTRPDEIVIMGDFLELESCSQHGGADLVMLVTDFAYGNRALDELQQACPGVEITYLAGNHETRLDRFLSSKAPSLLDALSVRAGLRLDERGVEWVPESDQPITRGDLDILHGHQVEGGRKSGGLPKHHAARVLDIYGNPRRKVVYGHTHKPQRYSAPGLGGSKRAYGVGCGRTLDPRWLHGAQAGWELEFAVVYQRPDGVSDFYTVPVTNGKFVWNGRVFGGEDGG